MNHYTYELIRVSDGEGPTRYIGVRSSRLEPEHDGYMSSSHVVQRLIKDGAKFEKTILEKFKSREEADAHEVKLHQTYDVARNVEYYNLHNASGHNSGNFGFRKFVDPDTNQTFIIDPKKAKSLGWERHQWSRWLTPEDAWLKPLERDSMLGRWAQKACSPDGTRQLGNCSNQVNMYGHPVKITDTKPDSKDYDAEDKYLYHMSEEDIIWDDDPDEVFVRRCERAVNDRGMKLAPEAQKRYAHLRTEKTDVLEITAEQAPKQIFEPITAQWSASTKLIFVVLSTLIVVVGLGLQMPG